MTPDLPTSLPAKVPSTSAWLALAVVLTTMLAVGRQTQRPAAAPTASQSATVRPAMATRRVAMGRPARPYKGASAGLVSASL